MQEEYRKVITLICGPCDAVTKREAEREYALRKHYRRMICRKRSKYCEYIYLSKVIDNANVVDTIARKSMQETFISICDNVLVCGDVITPNMKEQIAEAKRQHKKIFRMTYGEKGIYISGYRDKEEADEKQICQNSL